MKDADKHMSSILKRIRKNGCVLMLDFDGVLSPLVRIPTKARISSPTRRYLELCAAKMPVAIITGRTLSDIERRVALTNVLYAGSHGLEWSVNGRNDRRAVSRAALAEFASARHSLLVYANQFPQLVVEDKLHCLALGYRSLTDIQAARFRSGARAIAEKSARTGAVRLIDNLCTFEIIAAAEWTKGECARHIYEMTAEGSAIAVYIGDSLTDEDAFSALEDGITIRIGKDPTSVAQYYFKSRARVRGFLRTLASEARRFPAPHGWGDT